MGRRIVRIYVFTYIRAALVYTLYGVYTYTVRVYVYTHLANIHVYRAYMRISVYRAYNRILHRAPLLKKTYYRSKIDLQKKYETYFWRSAQRRKAAPHGMRGREERRREERGESGEGCVCVCVCVCV